MSEENENVTSTRNTNEKYYLGVIGVLVLALFYLLFLRGENAIAQTQQQTKQVTPAIVSQADEGGGNASADARAIKEGWSAAPIDDKMMAWLKAHNIKTIAFVDDKLQLMIADTSGKEIPVCARPVGATGVTGKCTEASEPVRYSIELSLERRGDASTYCWKRGGSWVCQ